MYRWHVKRTTDRCALSQRSKGPCRTSWYFMDVVSQFSKSELGVLQYPTTKALGAQPSISSEALHAPDNATGKVSSFAGKTGCAHWYWRTVLEPGPKWVTWLPTFNVPPSHPTSLINLNEVCQYARPHYWQSTGPSQGQQHGNSACSAHSPGKDWLLLMVNWWGGSTIIVSLEIGPQKVSNDGWWWIDFSAKGCREGAGLAAATDTLYDIFSDYCIVNAVGILSGIV